MSLDRRTFLSIAAPAMAASVMAAPGAAALMLASATPARAAEPSPAGAAEAPAVRAIGLDGFTTFDPRSVVAKAETYFPGKGAELGALWRTRLFEYTWLRTLMGRYADFRQVSEDALAFAAESLNLDLSAEASDGLMQAFLELKPWPDAVEALTRLHRAGVRLAFLSNLTAEILDVLVKNAGLEGVVEPHLSTDRVRAYKPDPRAYQMGIDAFGLPREQIGFAAFGGWDAAGAASFGYTTFWVNRAGTPVERLGAVPHWTGTTLAEMADVVLSGRVPG